MVASNRTSSVTTKPAWAGRVWAAFQQGEQNVPWAYVVFCDDLPTPPPAPFMRAIARRRRFFNRTNPHPSRFMACFPTTYFLGPDDRVIKAWRRKTGDEAITPRAVAFRSAQRCVQRGKVWSGMVAPLNPQEIEFDDLAGRLVMSYFRPVDRYGEPKPTAMFKHFSPGFDSQGRWDLLLMTFYPDGGEGFQPLWEPRKRPLPTTADADPSKKSTERAAMATA